MSNQREFERAQANIQAELLKADREARLASKAWNDIYYGQPYATNAAKWYPKRLTALHAEMPAIASNIGAYVNDAIHFAAAVVQEKEADKARKAAKRASRAERSSGAMLPAPTTGGYTATVRDAGKKFLHTVFAPDGSKFAKRLAGRTYSQLLIATCKGSQRPFVAGYSNTGKFNLRFITPIQVVNVGEVA